MAEMSNTLVPKHSLPNELEFHNALVAGLARAAKNCGRGTLADAMGISGRALDKIFAGGQTRAKHLFDALAAADCVLDDIADLYRRKFVLKGLSEGERLAPTLCAALHKVIDAEADGITDHRELLAMETELRAASKKIDALLDRITEVRKPRSVA
jgi:hypothetical protein